MVLNRIGQMRILGSENNLADLCFEEFYEFLFGVDAAFGVDIFDMAPGSILGYMKLLTDGFYCETSGEIRADLGFAFGKVVLGGKFLV